jgi:hypothetical protein
MNWKAANATSLSVGLHAPPANGISVFVLIDALGWKFIENSPFLREELPFRRPLRTVLGFSSGAIPSMLTGTTPAQNGHWNLFYYDPAGSPFRWLRHFRFLPRAVLDHRIFSKIVKEIGRRILGLGSLFDCFVRPSLLPWFNWVETRNIYARCGIGCTPSVFDLLDEKGVAHKIYSYHEFNDDEILRQSKRDVESGAGRFFFLYLSELDMVLHHHAAASGPVEARLKWYAEGLSAVFDAARARDPNATFVVTSDHGMAEVQSRFDLVAEIESLGFSMPGDYLAVYDSTMARYWFFNPRARGVIQSRLATLSCGRILSDAELQSLGILFDDYRFGQTIFLLNPGCLIAKSDFNGAGWHPSGMHGYHPDDPDSDAVFLSNRQFASNPRSITDVYRCMQEVI